jgi:hypothetical protein
MTPRYRRLLWLAGGLAAIRFVVFPWLDLQAQWHDQLKVLTQRLDRSEALLANQSTINQALSSAREQNATLLNRFPEAGDDESFKRETQQQIAAVASELGTRVTYFDWLEPVESNTGLGGQRARMTVEGGMRSLALLQAQLETRMPYLFVKEISYELRTPIGGAWDFPSSSTFTFDFHYRRAKSK